MNIAVIGSNSFSGSSFCKYLIKKKINVFAFSRSKEVENLFAPYRKIPNYKKYFSFYRLNLNNSDEIEKMIKIIKKSKVKYIVNFAAQGMVAESWIKPEDWYFTNVVSNSILINKLSKLKIKKYLNFSTPEVYGDIKKLKKENNIFNPSTPYAISRAAQDLNLKAYFNALRFPVVFTRTANVYGPHQQLYRIIPKTIIKSLKNEMLELHGGGSSVRSFIHIDDVSSAIFKILLKEKNIGETFHISTKKFISIKDLVKKIHLKLNLRPKIKIVGDRSGKDHGYYLNSNKLRKMEKWKDQIELDEGIDETISWIKDNYLIIEKRLLEYKHKK